MSASSMKARRCDPSRSIRWCGLRQSSNRNRRPQDVFDEISERPADRLYFPSVSIDVVTWSFMSMLETATRWSDFQLTMMGVAGSPSWFETTQTSARQRSNGRRMFPGRWSGWPSPRGRSRGRRGHTGRNGRRHVHSTYVNPVIAEPALQVPCVPFSQRVASETISAP